ncbi:hypothetical protein C1J03_10010 [Sulfitobacter sp. SK012]|nr:hypothetical protein C1J03_10010 [Sulfitobacter sp. SK012]
MKRKPASTQAHPPDETIFHCDVHLIPRQDGDVRNPRGGVRGVIAEKQAYCKARTMGLHLAHL